jgi:hypothetical protein
MRGYVYVGPAGTAAEADLGAWVTLAVDVAGASGAPKPRRKC